MLWNNLKWLKTFADASVSTTAPGVLKERMARSRHSAHTLSVNVQSAQSPVRPHFHVLGSQATCGGTLLLQVRHDHRTTFNRAVGSRTRTATLLFQDIALPSPGRG